MRIQCMEHLSLITKLTALQAKIAELQSVLSPALIPSPRDSAVGSSLAALTQELEDSLAELSVLGQQKQPFALGEASWAEETSLLQLQRQVRQQKQLNQILQAIHASLDLQSIFTVAVDQAGQFLNADWSFLAQYDAKQQLWHQVAQSNLGHPLSSAPLKLSEHQLEFAPQFQSPRQNVRPLRINPATQDEFSGYKVWLSQCPGSWLLLPLYLPPRPPDSQTTQLWGLMALGLRSTEMLWDETQVEFAQTIGQAVAIAIQQSLLYHKLQQANQELKALALTDSLTNLANRRQFDRHLNAEWQRLTRDQKPLSLILCDIDYFKRYNDHYGHPMGDSCLGQVAQALLKASRRPADLVARYGGEEFAAILPNTDTQGAYKVAYSMRQALEKLAIPHVASLVSESITVTMGIATIIPKRESSPQDLLQAADLALYHAKQQGRDRIYVHALYTYPPTQQAPS